MNVAVLMGVYGGDSPKLFERALQSILDQRVPSVVTIRIYLGVDGPVPRETERIIANHANSLHAIVRNTHSSGLACLLNRLLVSLDDEEYVFRMDADDRSLPDRFHQQLVFMNAHPEIGILGSSIIEVHEGYAQGRTVVFADSPEHAREMICRRVPVAHPTVCFRRSVFSSVPAYPEIRRNEDIAMWFECMARGIQFTNLPQPLLEFSISSEFYSRRGSRKALNEFQCYWRGIVSIWGVNWRLIYPVLRLVFRLSPERLRKLMYQWR